MIAMKTLQFENGFTLIEVLIAIAVLSIGILALYTMQTNSIIGNSNANTLTTASTWASDQIENFISLQYSNTSLNDTDGDGTGQDSDGNGIDDNENNFGLDDKTASTADGNASSQDGRYTIFWNVAVGVPMPNLKTVRVIVQDNSNKLSRPVTFTYIKADII